MSKQEWDCGKERSMLCGICARFGLLGEVVRCMRLDSGHINETYRVFIKRRGQVREYALQKVNTYVFQNPIAMMENIVNVTQFLQKTTNREGGKTPWRVLQFCKTREGTYYVQTEDGAFWRCSLFIQGSVSYAHTNNLHVVEESGRAYGAFGRCLSVYPASSLHIVIPHFHNTPMRYTALKEAVAQNAFGRAAEVEGLLSGFEQLKEVATSAYRLQCAGVLPLRVTHNDTKLGNVLFDGRTNDALAVVDLDTVMPGLLAFDFGDAIRAGASTASEDEGALERVRLDFDKFQAFTKGYLSEVGGILTPSEFYALPLGAVAMTTECGVRFLTDYLNGDKYFRIHYPKQNLARARAQLRLAQDMAQRLEDMHAVVARYKNDVH